jgi:hypothetical protein
LSGIDSPLNSEPDPALSLISEIGRMPVQSRSATSSEIRTWVNHREGTGTS